MTAQSPVGYPDFSGDLQTVEVFHDAVELLTNYGAIDKKQAEELNGFAVLPASFKEQLLGVPFLILMVHLRQGHRATYFAELTFITTNNVRGVIRDSSKGILEQVKEMMWDAEKNQYEIQKLGIWVRKGLRFQDFPYTNENGVTLSSRTYYLDM